MTTTITAYAPDQIAAAYRLHDTCHELTGVLADEPTRSGAADYEQRWQEWHDAYGRAYRVHEDAEHDYRHAFGHAETIPEAHEVIAVATATRVELLRAHVIETVTQVAPFDEPGTNEVVIDCTCGAVIHGEMPEHLESTTGSLMWLMAEHIARELPA